MKFFNKFTRDDRAVSPVIGVVLMVAVVVILAAVIGAFVLGLGDNLGGSQAPNAQVNLADSTTDTTGAEGAIAITHNGGDDLTMSDLQLVAYDADGTSIESKQVADSGSLSIGESTSIDYDSTGDTTAVEIRLIHGPSQSSLATVDVDLTNFSWEIVA